MRQKLSDARTKKTAAQKEDASNRQKWLEEIAQEAQKDSPNTEWEVILKRMIEAARMKQLHLKLTGIVRGGRSGLDYIEVPDNEWYFDHQTNELFCFKEGLFYVHVCIDRADRSFTTKGIIKKLPDSAVIATVDSNADSHQLK